MKPSKLPPILAFWPIYFNKPDITEPRYMYKFFACAALSLFIFTSAAYADFDAGFSACKKKNYAAAMAEWRPMEDQGSVYAQHSLGLLYANGAGMPKDYKEAIKWHRLAAEQGNVSPQTILGTIQDRE